MFTVPGDRALTSISDTAGTVDTTVTTAIMDIAVTVELANRITVACKPAGHTCDVRLRREKPESPGRLTRWVMDARIPEPSWPQ
jgi:hypothetical protein